MIRLLFICGSPRKAATDYAMSVAEEAATSEGDVEVTRLNLSEMKFSPCRGCNACVRSNSLRCRIYDDDFQDWNERFYTYDGILIGTAVYEMNITPQLCAFFSRFRSEYLNAKKDPFARMYLPGAALAVGGTRNGGQESAIRAIHSFYYTEGMPVVDGGMGAYGGACVWSQDKMAKGAEEDKVGLECVSTIAIRLARTAKVLKAGRRK